MAQMAPNKFTSWELTSSEQLECSILPQYIEMNIQNKIAMIANEKVAMTLDPNNINAFIQREAELQGQLLILQALIDESNEAKAIKLEMAKTGNSS